MGYEKWRQQFPSQESELTGFPGSRFFQSRFPLSISSQGLKFPVFDNAVRTRRAISQACTAQRRDEVGGLRRVHAFAA